MRPAVFIVVTLAIATALPSLVAAQMPAVAESRVALRMKAPEAVIESGSILHVPIMVDYSTSVLAQSLEPTTVRLSVVEAPAAVQAAISPATLSIPIHPGGGTSTHSFAQSRLTFAVTDDVESESILIRIRAVAENNGYIRGSEASEQLIVFVARPPVESEPDVCVTAHGEDVEEGEIKTQSAGYAAVPTVPLAGLGVAGAALGFVLAVRRARR